VLRFLADENIHSEIIAYLRDKNCDVLAIAQEKSLTGSSDCRLEKLGLILLRYAFFDIGKIKAGLSKAIDEIKSKKLNKESSVIVLDERKMRVRR